MAGQTAEQPIRGPLISRSEFLYALGYGINCAWIIVIVQFIDFEPTSQTLSSSFYIYLVIALSFLAITLLSGQRWLSKLLSQKRLRWTVAIALFLATLVMTIAGFTQQLSTTVWFTCASIIGLGSPLLFMIWAEFFARLNYRELVVSNILSYLLNAVVIIATTLFGFIPNGIVLAFLPLISVGVLTYIHYTENKTCQGKTSHKSVAPQPVHEELQADKRFPIRVSRLAIMTLFVFIIAECARTVFENAVADIEVNLVFANEIAAAIGLAMVVLLLLLFTFYPSRHKLSLLYRFSSLLLIFSSLVLPFASQWEGTQMVPYAFNLGAYQCFSVVIWVSAILYGASRKRLIFVVGLSQLAWALGSCLGIALANHVITAFGTSFAALSFLSVILTLCAAVAALFILPDRLLLQITRSDPLRSQETFFAACASLAERFSLTNREREIFELLASGKNASFVQEDLFLTKSTVNTHRYHIYQKLGVSSQQELINKVKDVEQNLGGV